MKMTKFNFMLLFCLLLSAQTYAQVTIGSREKPVEGALLDLKEKNSENGNANANKGLALPRVKILSKNIPANGSLAQTIQGSADTTVWDQYEHVGLVVYATDRFGSNPVNCPGVYVWDGNAWQSIFPKSELKPDITMTDADGNVYKAKWFGENPCDPDANGAYWTTSNLYSTQKGTGGSFTNDTPILSQAYDGQQAAVIITSAGDLDSRTIPDYGLSTDLAISTGKNITGQSYLNYAKEYGLLYTWEQANEACPPGWHLPTVEEWNDLYSWHGNSGPKMRKASVWKSHFTSADGKTYEWGKNDSNALPEFSGFDVVPAGYGEKSSTSTFSSQYFGRSGYFWTATSSTIRWLNFSQTHMGTTSNASTTDYHSARCVKDK